MGVQIRISPVAFMKMQTLVMGYDKEVGWFGTCEQIGPLEFRIKDILVFPQYTSGCFVDDERDDPLEFRKWLDTLSDEQYEQRRLWGHSHVNMATYPSGTDTSMFKRFAETSCAALVNQFAICVILNKRLDMYWWVFDKETNKAYEKKDVSVMIEVEEGVSNLEYYESTKEFVRDIRPTTAFLFSNGYSYSSGSFGSKHESAPGYNYGGYNSYISSREEKKEPEKKNEKKSGKKVEDMDSEVIVLPDDDWEYSYYPYEDKYGALDDFNKSDGHVFDVTIESDSVSVIEIAEHDIDYKIDSVIEELSTGDIYRFNITEDELVADHPFGNDSLAMTLIESIVSNEAIFFSVYQLDKNGDRIYFDVENDEDAMTLLGSTIHSSVINDGYYVEVELEGVYVESEVA